MNSTPTCYKWVSVPNRINPISTELKSNQTNTCIRLYLCKLDLMADSDSGAESVKEPIPKRYKPNPSEGDQPNPMIRRFADDEEDAVDDEDMGLVLRKRSMRNAPLSRLWLPVEKVQASGEIVTEWVLAPEGVVYCAWCKTGTDHNVYNCKYMDWTKETYCGMCDSIGHQEPDCSEMESFLGCSYDDDY